MDVGGARFRPNTSPEGITANLDVRQYRYPLDVQQKLLSILTATKDWEQDFFYFFFDTKDGCGMQYGTAHSVFCLRRDFTRPRSVVIQAPPGLADLVQKGWSVGFNLHGLEWRWGRCCFSSSGCSMTLRHYLNIDYIVSVKKFLTEIEVHPPAASWLRYASGMESLLGMAKFKSFCEQGFVVCSSAPNLVLDAPAVQRKALSVAKRVWRPVVNHRYEHTMHNHDSPRQAAFIGDDFLKSTAPGWLKALLAILRVFLPTCSRRM